MSNTKHTPGPWGIEQTARNNWIGLLRADGKINVIVTTTDREHLKDEALERNDANAKLIASAPELLEALQRLHGILSQTVFYDSYPELIEPTESAIEKATN